MDQPELVGREEPLGRLRTKLGEALMGKGSTILVAGEAGIGKTRLVSELVKGAEGIQIIKGWCLAESFEPLMPIREALRGAGLYHLVAGAPPPKVISAYLQNNAGMLIAKAEREVSGLDPDIFTAMLRAVGDFVKDSFSQMGREGRGLNVLGFGKYQVVVHAKGRLSLACVIEGEQSEFLADDMKQALLELSGKYDDWSGSTDEVEDAERRIAWFIEFGKYDGRYLVDDAKTRQENLFDSVLLGIQRASRERPTVLFIDDLQWADPTTLNLLHYLARNTRKDRVLILGTYRPEDMLKSPDGKPHQLELVMQNMSREDLFESMELKRLGSEDTMRVMNSVLGKTSFERGFYDKINKEAGGTPFFILEVVRLLAEEGAIAKGGEGTWELAREMEKLNLPTKVYDVVKRRLDRLLKEQREMLEWASVIGEEFSTDVLGRATETKKIALLKNLGEIERTHRLIHFIKSSYKFDHAKIREVLYSDIGDELRLEYHRIVGETIAGLHKEDMGEVVGELAHHYFEARDERAGEYLVKSGDRAREKYANGEAIKSYRNSLEFLKEDEKACIMEKLGDVQVLVGDYDGAVANFEAAGAAAKDDEAKSRALRKMSEINDLRGEFGRSLELLARAKGLAKECTAEHARITQAEGLVHWRKGELDKGLAIVKTALGEFEESRSEKKDIGNALRSIGSILLSKGDYDEALRSYEKSLAVMEGISDPYGIAAALNNMGIVRHRKGEQDMALELYGRSLVIVEKIGFKQNMATTLNNIGNVYLNKGKPDKALEFYGRCLPMVEKMGDRSGIAMSLNNMGIVHHWRGDTDKALGFFWRSLTIKEAMGDKRGVATTLDGIGLVYYDMGELEKALDYHERSLGISLEIGFKREMADNYCGLAETNHDLGNFGAALENAKKAVEIAVETKSKVQEGIGHRVLGMACRAKGEMARAEEEFGKSAKILEEIDEKRELARLFYEYGLLCKAKGEAAKQREYLERALSAATQIGMKLWVEKCGKALGEMGAGERPLGSD